MNITIQPGPADVFLKQHLKDALDQWGSGLPRQISEPNRPTGHGRVREARALVEEALQALGDRKGDRATVARSYLTDLQKSLSSALEAFESVGLDCDGPAFVALAERMRDAQSAEATAKVAFDLATAATVHAARSAHDVAAANLRAVYRECDALSDALAVPFIPDPRLLKLAKTETLELVARARRGVAPATTLHMALEQGARTALALDGARSAADFARTVAKLWVAFEPASPIQALELRYQRYQESLAAPVAATAPETDAEAAE